MLNTVFSPIILSVTPSHLIGRVSAVFSPAQQLASIVSMVLAGVLASTVLNGFHAAVGPIKFGPYDTVFAAGGLLFVIAGIASIAPLSKPAEQAPTPDMANLPIYHIASETEWTLASSIRSPLRRRPRWRRAVRQPR